MPWSGRLSCTVLLALAGLANVRAADPTPTPTPEPTPIPNTVDLSKFRGRFQGGSEVTLDSGEQHLGTSRARISTSHRTAARLVIKATIKGGKREIEIGNTFFFNAGGVVHGKYLAPGILDEKRFEGLYTATLRRITFSGAYRLGDLTGRATGTLTSGKRGRFTLRYQIFPGESVVPAYSYQYSGRIPR
ncbi:MAG TPA: hypothetical protein VIM61_12565 [Chthoniobacterales bacterium]|jgi:hypothetical protein